MIDSIHFAAEPGIRGFRRDQPFAWPLVAMGDLVTLNYGKALTATSRVAGHVPVYGSNGITGWHNKPLASGPTVVLGRKGQGPLGVEWSGGPLWVIDTAYYVTFKDPRLHPKFFYYFTDFVGLNHLKDGTSNPSLTRATFDMQQIVLPPLDEQRRIAAILGALDDKIEINRKMNRTLEAMAQALFKSWFIDFDGHEDFVESEIGPVPRGWGIGTLGDVAEITMGQSPPGSTYNEHGDGLPFFQGATDFGPVFPTNRVYCSAPTRFGEEWDVLVSVRAPVGRTNLAVERCAIGRGVASIRSRHVRAPSFVWCLIHSLAGALDVYNGEGTVFGSINKKALHALKLVVPHEAKITAFEAKAGPLLSRLRLVDQESRTLASLRDSLLPKLISGEIRVPEAEAVVEADL